MKNSSGTLCGALTLLCLLGGQARGQGYYGASGQIVWNPASDSRGIPRMGTLRIDVGYQIFPWLEVGVGTGLVLAKQRGAPPGGVAPRQQLFNLEDPEMSIRKSGGVEPTGSGGSSGLESTEGGAGSPDSGTQVAPTAGAQVMATSRLMLPRLSRYVSPFLELEGGIHVVEDAVEASGAWAAGLQLTPTKTLALSLTLGYRVAHQSDWGTEHMLLLGMGMRKYF